MSYFKLLCKASQLRYKIMSHIKPSIRSFGAKDGLVRSCMFSFPSQSSVRRLKPDYHLAENFRTSFYQYFLCVCVCPLNISTNIFFDILFQGSSLYLLSRKGKEFSALELLRSMKTFHHPVI